MKVKKMLQLELGDLRCWARRRSVRERSVKFGKPREMSEHSNTVGSVYYSPSKPSSKRPVNELCFKNACSVRELISLVQLFKN